jgi:hypothetical protein
VKTLVNDILKRPDIADWQAVQLRLTAFPAPSPQIESINWWSELAGDPPEKITSQPRTSEQIEEGAYENGKLELTVHPIRIHWRYTISEGTQFLLGKTPILGGFSEVLDVFHKSMNQWFDLETCPTLVRLAFGAILLQPAENHVAAYNLLSTYLPSIDLDSENSSDFFYQINRVRKISMQIADLRINRLSKWSTNRIQVEEINTQTRLPDLYACRLELDISTPNDFDDELRREQLPEVFNELVDFGKEIAEKGDIP